MTRAVIHVDEKKSNSYKLLVEGDNLQAVMATPGKSSVFLPLRIRFIEYM